MTHDSVFSGDAILLLCGLIDDIDSVFRLLVGGSKVAAFHNVDAHKAEKVP